MASATASPSSSGEATRRGAGAGRRAHGAGPSGAAGRLGQEAYYGQEDADTERFDRRGRGDPVRQASSIDRGADADQGE